ncbi:MAG TPA: TetR/AcrR family transcriptional regulator [Anaerolineaceae bacterium]|nr:TetR/AcrR family transcriptional regulator [Anaerolineaceae bacterium]
MSYRSSKLETIRKNGKTQVIAQRNSILDAAEKLFLEKGLEHTNMTDIAAEADITRPSLYRYFPDRDPMAFEIAVRMLRRIVETSNLSERPLQLKDFRLVILRMIDQFDSLRDAYRYIGMFDHLYGTRYPNEQLAAWYKEQIFSMGWGFFFTQGIGKEIPPSQAAMIGNSTMSFLEKMADRGELMAGEQNVSLTEELAFYRDMVNDYFDKIERESQDRAR